MTKETLDFCLSKLASGELVPGLPLPASLCIWYTCNSRGKRVWMIMCDSSSVTSHPSSVSSSTHPLSLHILHITLSPSSVTSHPPYHPLHITPPILCHFTSSISPSHHPLSLHILHITLFVSPSPPSSVTSHPPSAIHSLHIHTVHSFYCPLVSTIFIHFIYILSTCSIYSPLTPPIILSTHSI